MLCNSWIIYDKATMRAVMETWQQSILAKLNTKKYAYMTAHQWLVSLNKRGL